MRLSIVNGNYKPAWGCGGPARLAYELGTHFRMRQWDVTVVTSNFSGESNPLTPGHVQEEGIDVHRLELVNRSRVFGSASAWPKLLFRTLYREIQASDAVLVLNTRSAFAVLSSMICRRLRVPYALAALGSLPGGAAPLNRAVRRVIDPSVIYPNCRGAAVCVGQTKHECLQYENAGV